MSFMFRFWRAVRGRRVELVSECLELARIPPSISALQEPPARRRPPHLAAEVAYRDSCQLGARRP